MYIELNDVTFQDVTSTIPKMNYVKQHGQWICKFSGHQIKIVLDTHALRVEVKDTVKLVIYNNPKDIVDNRLVTRPTQEVHISYNGTTGGIYSIQVYDPLTETVTDVDSFDISPLHQLFTCIQYDQQ